MKYFVQVGDQSHEVVIDGESVTLDGQRLEAGLDDLPGTPFNLVRVGREVHRVVGRRGEQPGRYTVSVDGFAFDVEALDERTRTIRALARASARPSGPANLRAPMPGLIVRVNVKEGDLVRAGQGVVVMEAMKMENELRAATPGRVRRVHIAVGSAVEKGAMLLEMEG